MSLVEDLPSLSGWVWAPTLKGYVAQQPPYPFSGNQALVAVKGPGWLVAMTLLQNDPDMLVTVTLDGTPYYYTPRQIFREGSVGTVGPQFTVPLIGVTIAEAPQVGPCYGMQYSGPEPVPFGKGLGIGLAPSVPTATILNMAFQIVQVVDPVAFLASANILYGGGIPASMAPVAKAVREAALAACPPG
jgi:hypothetical protein